MSKRKKKLGKSKGKSKPKSKRRNARQRTNRTNGEDSRIVDLRMDFVWGIAIEDVNGGSLFLRPVPNPRRYELIDDSTGRFWFDKLDNLRIPEEMVNEALKEMREMPVSCLQRRVDDIAAYLKSRIPTIEAGIRGESDDLELSDASGEYLSSINRDKQGFAVMCVDLVGSTKLGQSLSQDEYARLIQTLTYELSELVFIFRGHVLKYTGDGLIAYFPEPSLISMHDLCFDCAKSMLTLVEYVFNPVCVNNSLPEVKVRIGIDSGEAHVITIGSAVTKRQKDLIGTTISIASKIQSLGSPGDIMIGEAANRLAHTMWREGLDEFDLPTTWEYTSKEGLPYKVYRMRRGFRPTVK